MTGRRVPALAGGAILLFLLGVTLPYAALVALFGYDDVLREPPAVVLARFREGGAPLVWAWAAFAGAALAFAPVAALIDRALGTSARPLAQASALAQFLGLARWALVIPALAAQHDAPGRAEATETAYLVLHQVLGVAVGEVLGQLLLLGWTARLSWHFLRHEDRGLGGTGLLVSVLWGLALTEPLATALPGLPAIQAAPLAFPLWELWLAALALRLLLAGARRPAGRALHAAG